MVVRDSAGAETWRPVMQPSSLSPRGLAGAVAGKIVFDFDLLNGRVGWIRSR